MPDPVLLPVGSRSLLLGFYRVFLWCLDEIFSVLALDVSDGVKMVATGLVFRVGFTGFYLISMLAVDVCLILVSFDLYLFYRVLPSYLSTYHWSLDLEKEYLNRKRWFIFVYFRGRTKRVLIDSNEWGRVTEFSYLVFPSETQKNTQSAKDFVVLVLLFGFAPSERRLLYSELLWP